MHTPPPYAILLPLQPAACSTRSPERQEIMRTSFVYTIDAVDREPAAIALAVLVRPAGTRWRIEPIYHDATLRPLGEIGCLYTPAFSADALLDAALVFYPAAFATCPALAGVRAALTGAVELDLTATPPFGWQALRAEARWRFRTLCFRQAAVPVK
jgi:hypothetical protein